MQCVGVVWTHSNTQGDDTVATESKNVCARTTKRRDLNF